MLKNQKYFFCSVFWWSLLDLFPFLHSLPSQSLVTTVPFYFWLIPRLTYWLMNENMWYLSFCVLFFSLTTSSCIPLVLQITEFPYFYEQIIFHYISISQFFYLFIHWRASGLTAYFSYCEQGWKNMGLLLFILR
jgi:hypothetical protein